MLPFPYLGYKQKPESLLGTTLLGYCGVTRPGLKLMDTWCSSRGEEQSVLCVARDVGRGGKGAGQQIQRSKD